ncbi:MAG: lipoyl synthase [Planctomycetota bacterium]
MQPRSKPDEKPGRKPGWLRVRAPGGETHVRLKRLVREQKLHTVCEEARCPNLGECWSGGTATIMLLGDVCTRACRFCAVKTGNPHGQVDSSEPAHVAESVARLGLTYVVLTSVDRDDLEDGGAEQFSRVVGAIRERAPDTRIEILTGDFSGRRELLRLALEPQPDLFAHNLETVERLTPRVRDRRATYGRSLEVLKHAKEIASGALTKSSLMVGLGETEDELIASMGDLRACSVDLLTIGQYLRPSSRHLPVEEYVTPERFQRLAEIGKDFGFLHVASGPLVRSSYRAGEDYVAAMLGRQARAGE